MALINCPECEAKISDLALSCPHCGYPLENRKEKNEKYNVIIFSINCGLQELLDFLSADYTYTINDIYHIANNLPFIIEKNVSKDEADTLKSQFEQVGVNIALEPYYDGQSDDAIRNKYRGKSLRCPRCHSTAITTGTKGYGFIRGFLGSNKTVNRCGSCGYSWEP